ncbi:SdrD B-like domain-containing protein [Pararoseomonas indoligenes]|uniref:Carboxypeptidase regulatory-like domain-containing protein n=1 Tax=Roseomonas indoligenes TaxID=2820811 RepID=A0A940N1K8_9PROT|nr:SdrD B-like domain-containing protein [Pararoseomonas indoligenes]MBP0492577.1 carboxypeptidase regulatory-like domain-containing protein [Pararoseomonas indoligenes]
MAVTVDTALGSVPGNSNVTLLTLGTSTITGEVTDNTLRFGAGNTITFAGTSGVYHGTLSGTAATPYGEAGNYFAVGSTNPATINYSTVQRYFGLQWGSVDAGNTISFYNGSTLVYQITGAQVESGANGSQGADGTIYVNINFTSPTSGYNRVVVTSPSPAFEFGRVASSTVNIPTTAGQLESPTVVTATDTTTGKIVGFDSAPASLSGTVFRDTNADGTQGTADSGVSGVTVRLYNSAGTLVSTDVTDANGRYDFANVAAGTYSVRVAAPSGSSFSPTATGASGSGVNSSGNGTITLAAGSSGSVNAGVYTPGTISGFAFTDTNGNGTQDLLEPSLGGQTVQLLNSAGTVVATTSTSILGAYSFTGVVPGTYTVQFSSPAGTVFTAQDQGTNDAVDSDVGSTGRTAPITLTSGGSVTNVAAGSFVPATVSGAVFTDSNGDGIRATGDAAVVGATVQLVNTSGAVVATTTTSSTGAYSFTGVAPGTYQVQFVSPSGTVFTLQNQGLNTAVDSDAGANGRTASFVLVAGGSVTNLSAGVFTPVSVSGTAFVDANADGIQGTGEAGIAGQTVTLLNALGLPVATTTTGANGAYSFTGLQPGTYQVQFPVLTGAVFSPQDQGTNDAVDSDANALGRTATITLASGASATNVSAGSYVPATVSGVGFVDVNGDGVQGTGELGVVGQAVQLLNSAGNVVATTVTGVGGAYSFVGVTPGTYQVQFLLPGGSAFTGQDQGTNDAVDSDVNAAGRTAAISLTSGSNVANVSAGSFVPGTIAGSVFNDVNGNGIRNPLAPVVAGATVQLLNSAGAVVATTTTSALGNYAFTNVAPGTYQVQFVAPSGTIFTQQNQGLDLALDSDANPTTGRTGSITILSGGSNLTTSAGVFTPISVAGNFFTDVNGDGIQGTGETGIAGQSVQLLNALGAVVATTTTGANGAYSFTNIVPGTYQVQFTAPNGAVFTAQNQGSNTAVDSDVNASGRTGLFTLTSGQSAPNISAGAYVPATIGGVGFLDNNGDGIQTAGEGGVAGQTVQLLNSAGAVVATTTTSSTGAYSFTGIVPGTYQVQFTAQSGTVFTTQDRGTNDAVDSDVSVTTGRTPNITVGSGQVVSNVSAGSFTPVSIGGVVFGDTDADGIRTSGEAGVTGVTVRLLDADGAVVATTTTGTGGAYNFTGVAPGQYQVQFVAPNGTVFSPQDQGTSENFDSDANPSTGTTALISLASGRTQPNVGAGIFTPASTGTGNIFFLDANGNGVRDAGEAGITGATVQLLNSAGTAVATTTTDSNGTYSFTGVTPGTYQVQFTAPNGAVFTAQDQGTNEAVDSDVNGAGRTASIAVSSGGTISNVGAGAYVPVSVSGRVFTDTNGDGIQGSGEAGATGQTVQLLNAAGAVVATTTTGSGGAYSFTGLTPGQYQVQFAAPSGSAFTLANQGSNSAADSDANPATGRSALLTLASGQTATNVSAGTYVPVSVSGTAFTDTNGDGVQGTGETGASGQTVQLLNTAGAVVATTTTGSGGAYSFTGLPPGTYQVQFAAPAGAVFTAQDQGGNDAVDSDVAPTTGRTAPITLASGQAATNVSAGSYTTVSLGGVVFADANGDGVQGTGEAGVAGQTVQLLNSAGAVVATTTTSATGAYSFTGVAPGTYQVGFVTAGGTVFTAQDQGNNDAVDSDANPATGRTAAIILPSGGGATNISAGIFTPTTVSGSAFVDANGDGVLNGGEAGAAGVAVQLLASDGTVVATTTTSSTGAYSFTGVAPGTYQVQFTGPNGTVFTAQDQGANDAIDSDVNATGRTGSIVVGSGQAVANVSAGFFTPTSVSGTFFTDTNGDGIQGTGEAGVAGQTVQLLNAAGAVVATTSTGAGGAYSFANVTPGTYQVQFAAAAGTVFTAQDQGGNDAVDSDAGANGRTAAFTLASGGSAANVSAGTFTPVTVSGNVFTDANGDGIRNAGEAGVSGTTVQLANSAGAVVATTATSNTGAYSFTGVVPGSYQVQFVGPSGTVFTNRDVGTDDTVDSDAGSSGRTPAFTLASGESATNISAGIFTPTTVSGSAFVDANGDGVLNGGEAGAAGVAVQLLASDGTVVATTTTSSTGAYSFTGVAPGTYQVQFTGPNGTVFTAQDQGANDAIDSDVNATGRTGSIVVGSGQAVANVSAGFFTPTSVSGTFFTDTNGDGIQGTGEAGVAGQTVQLLNAAGAVVATTSTGAGGAYSFANVTPGTYQVQFAAAAGTVFTAQDQGGNDAVDSDAGANGRTAAFTLASGGSAANVSAGTFTPVTVSGNVFTDANGDGIRNAGEAGVSGTTVQLLNGAGAVVATTTTGAGGAYSFTGVAPDTYQVQFVGPAGTVFTTQDVGGDDTVDSDAEANGRSDTFTLASGGSIGNVSAGVFTPVTVSGSFFTDTNGDGIRGTNEAGIVGQTVQLLNGAGAVVATTTTGTGGAYSFAGVAPGTYQVQFTGPNGSVFTAQDRGSDDTVDSDVGANGRSAAFTLASGGSSASLSAGAFVPANINGANDFVFADNNRNGIRDAGETGLAGITVQLLNLDGTVAATTTTTATGGYSFTGLTPGQYQLQFVAPNGATFSPRNIGPDDTIDSDVTPSSGRSTIITLNSGGTLDNYAAGLFVPASITGANDFVFLDNNNNGVRDAGEGGLAGVTVQLLNPDGTVAGTTTTRADGTYSFTGVAPGQYQVQFVAPDGATFSPRNIGDDDTVDSDVTPTTGRSTLFTLSPGGTLNDLAAGLFLPGGFGGAGDAVFADNNRNGIRDAGEGGLAGITVQLLNPDGTVAATTTTGADGTYSFPGVAPGQYQVQFVAPTGATFSPADAGTDDTIDSDAAPGTGRTATVTVSPGGTVNNVAAGLFVPASVSGAGDIVFADNNRNGIRDVGETGLAGITVQLLNADGTVAATTTTGANGTYSFAGVTPGQYQLQFVAPNGATFSPDNVGVDDTVDSDVAPATGRSALVDIGPGGTLDNLAAGLFVPASFAGRGDVVFADNNRNGIRDAGEGGVAGVTVQLLNPDGTVAATTTTTSTGAYSFTGVAPGTYQVQFVAPNGATFSPADVGTDDTIDSDAAPGTGRSPLVTVGPGGTVNNVAAGLFVPATVSGPNDFVFADNNRNGIRDPGETGLAGITVQLLNPDGTVAATTTTGADGTYSFAGVTPGQYQVQFVAPNGATFSPRNIGADDTIDSDVSPANGRTPLLTLAPGSTLDNLAAGLFVPGSVGGTGDIVFADNNRNGIRDAGETGLAGITVQLLNPDGTVAATTTTRADGTYSFAGVTPGQYQVQFVAPTGATFSPTDVGTDDTIDSDAAQGTGRTGLVTVGPGGTIDNLAAGLFVPGSFAGSGDVVFADNNRNGIRDAGEGGLAGVTVRLLNADGSIAATTTTAANGTYSFAGVAPGQYQVQFVAPNGATFSPADAGNDDAIDSDAAPGTGISPLVTVGPGGSVNNVAAGLFLPAAISGVSDFVFSDNNRNGIRDAGETGLAGITVQLLNPDGTVAATTTTTRTGAYSFTGVAPGQYQVQFVAPSGATFSPRNAGTDDTIDSDVTPSTGRTPLLTLAPGSTLDNLAAGIFVPASITGANDFVFADNNRNGIRDAGETGLAGITVQLLNPDGTVAATTTTGANGNYSFTGVAAGQYQVHFVAPTGATFSPRNIGPDDTIDSDVSPSSGSTPLLTLTPGATIDNLAAGLFVPGSFAGSGDVVFADNNRNGIRDAGEAGLAGITVNLLNPDGTVAATTTTNAGGTYAFAGVTPGQYQVEFVAPTGAVFSPTDAGTNDAVDSDADQGTGLTGLITVGPGGIVNNVAAGVFVPATISGANDFAFADNNRNGIRDMGEDGLAGITVQLLNPDGTVAATTTTRADGTYSFGDISAGRYQVQFVAPAGYAFSPRNIGTDDTIDSDVTPSNGRTPLLTLAPGSNLDDVAAGLYQITTQVGGNVYIDANGNGIHDAGEAGLAGVEVRLLDANGAVLGPVTTTDEGGNYYFTDLAAGSYKVQFAPLVGTAFTLQDQAGSEFLDSDASQLNGVSSLVVTLGANASDLRSTAGLVLALDPLTGLVPTTSLTDGSDGFPGTAASDHILGGAGNDSINGLDSNDALYGEDGEDSLNGHLGDDFLSGGNGNDNVQGQQGNDTILGGAGDDIGEGGDDNDLLESGAGNDNMQGEGGNDTLYGGSGNDILTGNEGNDIVVGGTGNDSLQGASGDDIVIGGQDDGRMSLNAAGRVTGIVFGDVIEGNAGADKFVWQAGDGVDFMLDFNPAEGDTLTIYGYTRFQAVERTDQGQIALYLDDNSGFILNNGVFQGSTPNDVLPGIRFVASTADAPGSIVGGDAVVPVLAQNWFARFTGGTEVPVSQGFQDPGQPATVTFQTITDHHGIAFT